MLSYFDICVNIDSSQLLHEADQIITDAQSKGVHRIALTGSSISSTQTAIEVAKRHKGCIATCGIHPHDASSYNKDTATELEHLSNDAIVRAIGECGLDYNRLYSTKEEQIRCFEGQLNLAKKKNLPVFFMNETTTALEYVTCSSSSTLITISLSLSLSATIASLETPNIRKKNNSDR